MKKSNIGLLVITIVALLFSNCKKDALYAQAPENPDKQVLLDLVNAYRASGCGCGSVYYPPVEPVTWNETLARAAQNHCNDMDEQNDLSHTGSDGSSPGHRLVAIGYSWSTCAENIAAGYETEKEVVEGWMRSSGHCRNIMNSSVTEIGAATKGVYWTLVLASH
jgi:uncharacterized protein YkwD